MLTLTNADLGDYADRYGRGLETRNVQREASEKTQNVKIKMVKREACSAKR